MVGNRERWVLRNITGIFEDGCLVELWGATRDFTDRKHAAQLLTQSEQRYRCLFEDLPRGEAAVPSRYERTLVSSVRDAAAFAQPEAQKGVIPLASENGFLGLVSDTVDVDQGFRFGGVGAARCGV